MIKAVKDNFSAQAAAYAQFRPVFPEELFTFLLEKTAGRDTAWDVGTGNGQVASVLAGHFEKVVATDISEAQLTHAAQKPNIEYRLERAEQTTLPDRSVDLVTIGQAIHWFDHAAFYKEVRRVARPGAVVAAFGYELPDFEEKELNRRLATLYDGTLHGYWEPERQIIMDHYETLPWPFEEIETPVFSMENHWERRVFEGYLSSWSAVKKFEKTNGSSPVPAFIGSLADIWPEGERRRSSTPVIIRAGRVL